jgi:Na+/phosphate symporter
MHPVGAGQERHNRRTDQSADQESEGKVRRIRDDAPELLSPGDLHLRLASHLKELNFKNR